MTYSDDNGYSATVPVGDSTVLHESNQPENKHALTNTQDTKNKDLVLLNTSPSQDGLVNGLEKLSMSESSMNHTSRSVIGPLENIAWNDYSENELMTSLSAKGVMKKVVQDSLLFLGDEDGDTTLHVSVMQEDEPKSFHIISRAPDFTYLNIQNNLLQTPLHLAALTNASKTVRKLICAGAEVGIQDRDGNTPLHIACSRGHLEIVKQLLKPVMYEETLVNRYPIPYMAIPQNMNMKNYDGLTCLHLAVLSQNVDILRFLLEADADPNVGDSKSGRTPLHLAAELGSLECVSLLISYRRTEIDALNYARHTPALLAYCRKHLTITKVLVRFGASYGFCYCYNDDASSHGSDVESDMDM